MLKYCADCNQEKPHEPSAPPRTKANGFYGWYCWDCHKQNALGRLQKRTGAQSSEYEALHAKLEVLKTETAQVKAALRSFQEITAQEARRARHQAQNEARNARPKALRKKAQVTTMQSGERVRIMSLPYSELVAQAQVSLNQFLQEVSKDHPDFEVRKRGLETKLEYAQNKLALFGPTAFDFMSAKAHE